MLACAIQAERLRVRWKDLRCPAFAGCRPDQIAHQTPLGTSRELGRGAIAPSRVRPVSQGLDRFDKRSLERAFGHATGASELWLSRIRALGRGRHRLHDTMSVRMERRIRAGGPRALAAATANNIATNRAVAGAMDRRRVDQSCGSVCGGSAVGKCLGRVPKPAFARSGQRRLRVGAVLSIHRVRTRG